uniref:Ankyrin repeat protein n=1 Tax=Panagrolaimus sp. PS1159 TaxID=55785 RepID=A0AC35G6L8_9BILA
MITYLIKHGADVNFANVKGDTPLFMAVRSSKISGCDTKEKVVRYLIKKSKADVNATNKDGETPLFAGIISETESFHYDEDSPSLLIKVLIKNGACVSSKNKNNETPFDVAIQRNINIYPHKHLMQAGIIYNSAYLVKKRDNCSQDLKVLLNHIHNLFLMAEKKKEMNTGDGDIDLPRFVSFVVNSKRENIVDGEIITESLLHVAVRANNLDAVKWLIKNKAHVSAIDSLKNTPEMIAESNHYDEILVHLKEAYHNNILSSDSDNDWLDYGDSDTSF